MKKNGFAIFELIAILAVLGIVCLLTITKMTNVLDKNKESEWLVLVSNIEVKAAIYFNESFELKKEVEEKGSIAITLWELKEKEVISSNLKNPKTKEKLNDDSYVEVKHEKEENSFNYEYKEVQ